MKRRSILAMLLATPAAFVAAMRSKVWPVSVVPFEDFGKQVSTVFTDLNRDITKILFDGDTSISESEIWNVEDRHLVRRDSQSGLVITGYLHSGDLRIGGIPHKDYPVQNL